MTGLVTVSIPVAVAFAVLPELTLGFVRSLNQLNVATLSIAAILLASPRTRGHRSKTRGSKRRTIVYVAIGLCVFWSAIVPGSITLLDEELYERMFDDLVVMFIFDASTSAIYLYYLERCDGFLHRYLETVTKQS